MAGVKCGSCGGNMSVHERIPDKMDPGGNVWPFVKQGETPVYTVTVCEDCGRQEEKLKSGCLQQGLSVSGLPKRRVGMDKDKVKMVVALKKQGKWKGKKSIGEINNALQKQRKEKAKKLKKEKAK